MTDAGASSSAEAICVRAAIWPADAPYVRSLFEEYQKSIGGSLAREIVLIAAQRGYRRMRLDTLASMIEARTLYASLGFREIPAYYDNPLGNPVYMEKTLREE